MRRKQMRRVLREVLSIDAERASALLESCGIDPAVRPETLSPEDFARVVRAASRGS
jgi:16S rRNA A1518/A1519 N6-dimethyltransferase RsmA/KsgA/DIM1 with predicted DNA glycosylase/AP lyase activity